MDWCAWHDDYDQPDSVLGRRLRVVQRQVWTALDDCPPGPLRVVSLCAGQGHDLLGVLARHPRRADVTARLVELDPRNVALANRAVESADLRQVEVVMGDAASARHYNGLVPAEVVLVCGVFGNITDEDVERTVAHCAQLCTKGGTLVWTRHREPPDLVPSICRWFEDGGFERLWLSGPDEGFGVGAHRFTGEPQPLDPSARLFTFIGSDVLAQLRKPS
ncbi:MAG: class I SAM-dependent methyltransferase [Actinomycetota bacterium]|nr:class I SAM-dependent methyltransferase [Actinomycetota bacterium]